LYRLGLPLYGKISDKGRFRTGGRYLDLRGSKQKGIEEKHIMRTPKIPMWFSRNIAEGIKTTKMTCVGCVSRTGKCKQYLRWRTSRGHLKNLDVDVDVDKIEVDLEEIGHNGVFQVRVQWRNFDKATMKEAVRFYFSTFLLIMEIFFYLNHYI
jgi:hypothetical protein